MILPLKNCGKSDISRPGYPGDTNELHSPKPQSNHPGESFPTPITTQRRAQEEDPRAVLTVPVG